MSGGGRFEVDVYLGRSEGQHFERKSLFEGSPKDKRPRDRTSVRDQIALQVAALANAEGGVLLLGVEDDGSLTGHGYPARAVDTMLEVPGARLDPPQPSGFRVMVEGHELLAFEVPMASTPVQVVGDGYPLRMGDQTVQAKFEQIQTLKLRGLLESFEARESRCELPDLDPELLERAQSGAGLSALTPAEYLVRRRLADLRGPTLVLRQAAELLFHRQLPDHPNAGVRIFRVIGTERRTGLDHNVEELPRVEGALPRVLGETYRTIKQLLRRPSRLAPGGRFRQTWEYPDFSWREAILNAAAHRDYAIDGRGIEVWLFDDRMEVTSPGDLAPGVSIERLLTLERVHASRNPRLVRTLVDLGFMRDQGEGLPRMFAEMEGLFLPRPELEAHNHEVRLTLRNTPIITDEDRAFVVSLGDQELTPKEFRALLEAHRSGRVDNAELRLISGLDTLGASAVLRKLRDRHLLDLHAAGGASYYTLPDDRAELDSDRGELEADRGEPEADAGEPEADAGELSESERRLVSGLGTRPRKEKLRRAIETLASRRPWRPADLARVLNRQNVEKLTERHLKPMVHDGQLSRTHPENPTHPEQAYFSTGSSVGPLFAETSEGEEEL